MAKFISGNELNTEVGNIFEKAESVVYIISPYIKLHHRYKDALRDKLNDDKFQITVVFGKNEDDLSKSLSQEEFDFFKEFRDVEIRYESRLHAKYFANDSSSIITSMNLYDYSQNNNIEVGILMQKNLLSSISGDSLDDDATEYFRKVADNSELIYKQEPQYESKVFGLSKKYTNSIVTVDKSGEIYSSSTKSHPKPNSFKKEKTPYQPKPPKGYCIRTGEEIPFNPERPFSKTAFKSWNQFQDEQYPEKYCHFSGEPSNGETSMEKPILYKNWKKAQKEFGVKT